MNSKTKYKIGRRYECMWVWKGLLPDKNWTYNGYTWGISWLNNGETGSFVYKHMSDWYGDPYHEL